MLGIIKMFNKESGYGFIADESGVDRFFHIGNFSDRQVLPQVNDTVRFEPYEAPKGPGATTVRVIGTLGNSDLINEISKWKMEAKLEDNLRYFYHTEDVSLLEDGSHCYVIGRKGTGKTAICEYLTQKSEPKYFSKKLTFKNFPFNDLYKLSNDRYTHPNQYITFWKYLIYSTIAQLMIDNENIDVSLRLKLAKLYSVDFNETLQGRISRITGREFEFKILGTGGKFGIKQEDLPRESSWIERVEVLEKMLQNNIDDAAYIVVFDELDEDYKSLGGAEASGQYSSLITSLFKAVQDVKANFSARQYNILPAIFLRNDIYSQIRDPDRSKWGDLSIELDWSTDQIKKLLAFRISRAINANGEVMVFDEAWARVFQAHPTRFEDGRMLSIFAYIARYTQVRPRDFIRYIRDCAKAAKDAEATIINSALVRRVEKSYSTDLRTELEDEIEGIIPEARGVINLVASLGKANFRTSEFAKAHEDAVKEKRLPERDYKFILEVLFNFSVVGNQTKENRLVFRYLNRDAHYNPAATFCVHRGLYKSLQLV